MPFDTGNLQNESTFADYANLAEGETKSYRVHRMPDGCIFIPNIISAVRKHVAARKWLAPWLKGGARQNFCQKAFARFYKQEAGL